MRPLFPRQAAPALALALFAATLAASPQQPPPQRSSMPATQRAAARGTLLIVGGGAQPPELVQRFVALAGGPGRARIAVLPMASSQPRETGVEKVEQLRSLGADAFTLVFSKDDADADTIVRRLQSATGIWFPGGDQVPLANALRGTTALRVIRERYAAGAVVGGTSAGAAIMSDSMMTGNQRRPGVDTTGYFGDEFPRVARGSIEIVPGLGFLSGAIVDQHFIRRERHNRLLSVVLERPSFLGVGIDEGTALLVNPDGGWSVEGASAVVVYDARAARVTAPNDTILGAAAVRLYVLPAGSRFDPRTSRATLPPR